MPEREIVRAVVTEVEIAVAAEDVLEAAVADAGAAGDPAVVAAAVDAMVVMAAVAEDGTKPLPRIFTDFTDQELNT